MRILIPTLLGLGLFGLFVTAAVTAPLPTPNPLPVENPRPVGNPLPKPNPRPFQSVTFQTAQVVDQHSAAESFYVPRIVIDDAELYFPAKFATAEECATFVAKDLRLAIAVGVTLRDLDPAVPHTVTVPACVLRGPTV